MRNAARRRSGTVAIGLVIAAGLATGTGARAQGTQAGRYVAHLIDQGTYACIHSDVLYTHYADEQVDFGDINPFIDLLTQP